MRTLPIWIIALSVVCLGASAAQAQPAGSILATPDKLTWGNATSLPPGAKLAVIEGKMSEEGPVTARFKLPANFRVPPHWHPGVERITVISGTFNIGMGDKFDSTATKALGPGSVVIMPAKMTHFAWTDAETIIQLNVAGPWKIIYVNPADDPRKK